MQLFPEANDPMITVVQSDRSKWNVFAIAVSAVLLLLSIAVFVAVVIVNKRTCAFAQVRFTYVHSPTSECGCR